MRTARKDERRYYEDLMQYSQEHLMLYPYHLSDVIVKGLRVTPFTYYINMMSDIMTQEKSYDSLPNFTAADCKLFSLCISGIYLLAHCSNFLKIILLLIDSAIKRNLYLLKTGNFYWNTIKEVYVWDSYF